MQPNVSFLRDDTYKYWSSQTMFNLQLDLFPTHSLIDQLADAQNSATNALKA